MTKRDERASSCMILDTRYKILYTFITMSGHSKWSQIKHKKAESDAKKSKTFSKIISAIIAAAREENDPASNPRLRTLIETARAEGVPKETIERALQKSETAEDLREIIIEAYGGEGTAILIEASTDNTNRTIAEVRSILVEHGAKLADPGSVRWLFAHQNPGSPWKPKFTKPLTPQGAETLYKLRESLTKYPDIHRITTDAEE